MNDYGVYFILLYLQKFIENELRSGTSMREVEQMMKIVTRYLGMKNPPTAKLRGSEEEGNRMIKLLS